MKTVTSPMRAHLDGDVTTLARCWYLRRTDGTEYYFTDLPRDLTFDGEIYLSSFGYTATALANNSSLAPDNAEVQGVIDNALITEQDLAGGLFNYAEYRTFMVNWADPDTHGAIKLKRGRLGEVTHTVSGLFTAELRGLSQALSQSVVNLYGPDCPADLGDDKCRVPVNPAVRANSTALALGDFIRVATGAGAGQAVYENRIYEVTTAGTTASSAPTYDETIGNTTTDGTAVLTARQAFTRHGVVSSGGGRKQFAATIDEPRAVDGWFDQGALVWESGDNEGQICEVKTWVQTGGSVTLYLSVPYTVQTGDRFRITPGCNKGGRASDGHCGNRFFITDSLNFPAARGNIWNFRGFNKIPGLSVMAQTPTAQG